MWPETWGRSTGGANSHFGINEMIGFIVLLNVAIASLVFTKAFRAVPLYVLALFYFLIDYANSYFDVADDLLGYLSKSYREILFLTVALHFVARRTKRDLLDPNFILVAGFVVGALFYGMLKNGARASFLDWRDSALPIAMALLAVRGGIVNSKTFNGFMWLVFYLTVANSLVAIYQYVNFDGIPQNSWRYEFLLEARQGNLTDTEERFVSYQIVRNANLRASGLMASALQYSYLAAMCAFFAIVQWRSVANVKGARRRISRYTAIALLPVLALGIYVSQVRSSLIILAASLASYLYFSRRGKARLSGFKLIGAICVSYACLLILLFFSKASFLDDSALGRVPQYLQAISDVTIGGAGLGAYRGQFDSYFVYGLLTYGAPFAVVIWAFFSSIKFGLMVEPTATFADRKLSYFVFPSLGAAAIIASVQHFSGSLYYQIIWFGVFINISHNAGKAIAMRSKVSEEKRAAIQLSQERSNPKDRDWLR